MRLRARLAALLASAATLTLLTPDAAHAAGAFPDLAPCVVPSPYNLKTVSWDPKTRVFAVDGTVVRCGSVDSQTAVRFATYRAATDSGRSPGASVRFIQRGSSSVGYRVWAVPPEVGTYGFCLIAGNYERISCAEITVKSNGTGAEPADHRASLRPIDVLDPLVDKKDVSWGPWGTGEDCATCF